MRSPFQRADVRSIEDFDTKEITVKGTFGVAPDGNTPYEYPVKIYRKGYWNKTRVSQELKEVKAELLSKVHDAGYDLKPSEVEVTKHWMRKI